MTRKQIQWPSMVLGMTELKCIEIYTVKYAIPCRMFLVLGSFLSRSIALKVGVPTVIEVVYEIASRRGPNG